MPLSAPRLWIVATPLGNPGDLSPRARAVLAEADLVLAEDTRRAAALFRQCGLPARRMLSFFDHNEEQRKDAVLRLLREGKSVALISDAGTPLLADPAFDAVYFQALLESLGGVAEARVNAAGRSLVVAYDGQPATWEKIAFNLKHMPEEAFPADHDAEQTVSGAAVTAKALQLVKVVVGLNCA